MAGDEKKPEQPPPNKTSEPDIPSFRYSIQSERRMLACTHLHNMPLAITCASPNNTCASH